MTNKCFSLAAGRVGILMLLLTTIAYGQSADDPNAPAGAAVPPAASLKSIEASEKPYITFSDAVKKIASQKTLLAVPTPTPVQQLQIISAKYGAKDRWLDIAPRLRSRIHDNQLDLIANNALAGSDVIVFPKELKVVYRLNGQRQNITVREGDRLQIPAVPDPYDPLRVIETPEELLALAQMCPAEVGFHGVNFATGKSVDYRGDQPACMASIVKLFVLLEVMHQADSGSLNLEAPLVLDRKDKKETVSINTALDMMILHSDNDATNALARKVGYPQVNALVGALNLSGISNTILPEPGVLEKGLTRRLDSPRCLPLKELPPQHGTARGMVGFFRHLHEKTLLTASISQNVLEVLERNPRYEASRATPLDYQSVGKGGSISVWQRPTGPSYNMLGWAIYIYNQDDALAFCLWLEWYPHPDDHKRDQYEWAHGLSNAIVHLLRQQKPLPMAAD